MKKRATMERARQNVERLRDFWAQYPDVSLRINASRDGQLTFIADMTTALDAICKQIPEKPIYVKTSSVGDNDFRDYVCPNCKEDIELEPIDHSENTWCLHCGQALDWSECNGNQEN